MHSIFDVEALTETVHEEAEEDAPLARLAAAVEVGRTLSGLADTLVTDFVVAARAADCSWADIGRTLGISRQAAHLRFAGHTSSDRKWPIGFSDAARRAVLRAEEHARRLGHNPMGSHHVLLALAREQDPVGRVLARLGLTAAAVEADLEQLGHPARPALVSPPSVATELDRVLELALDHAEQLGHRAVGSGHLLLAVSEDDALAAKILFRCHPITTGWLRSELGRHLRVDPARFAVHPPRRRRRQH